MFEVTSCLRPPRDQPHKGLHTELCVWGWGGLPAQDARGREGKPRVWDGMVADAAKFGEGGFNKS